MTYIRKIKKRSYKNFTQEIWIEELTKKDWSQVEKETNIDKKTEMYTKLVTEALDVCAPIKTFTIKSHYKFGLSDLTKDVVKKRDGVGLEMAKASQKERTILSAQYKKLRNLVNHRVRKETIDFNNKRVEDANKEAEMWNID